MDSKDHLFISYKSEDAKYAVKLAQELTRRGYNVWIDKWSVKKGARWFKAIEKAIQNCRVFIIIMTPEADQSKWVEGEILLAERYSKPIMPLLLRGDVFALLITLQYDDVRGEKLPSEDFFHELRQLAAPGDQTGQIIVPKKLESSAKQPSAFRNVKTVTEPEPPESRPSWMPYAAAIGLLLIVAMFILYALAGGDNPGGTAKITATATHFLGIDDSQTLTQNAIEAANSPTETATLWTDTPTLTLTFTPTFIPTATPTLTEEERILQKAEAGVSSNDEWTPYTQEFDGVEMVLVPAGCFMMGSTDEQIEAAFQQCEAELGEGECGQDFRDESPQNEQCFDKPFWIDKTEVTRAMWDDCVADEACEEKSTNKYSNENNQPVNNLTWFEAQDYCEWRGAQLPTEREWEYAARGSDNLIYPWGNEFDSTLTNFCDNRCEYSWRSVNYDDGYPVAAPAGSYPGGVAWVGALDMSGNLWEWVDSLYSDYLYSIEGNSEVGVSPDSTYVLRGGGFNSIPNSLRSAYRDFGTPDSFNIRRGFRCARDYE